jgi:hypothetical protein
MKIELLTLTTLFLTTTLMTADYKEETLIQKLQGKITEIDAIIFDLSKPVDSTNPRLRFHRGKRLRFLNLEKKETQKRLNLLKSNM